MTRRGCDDVCVLISKAELESLERALQIFAESTEFQQMSSQIAEIVAAARRADRRRRWRGTAELTVNEESPGIAIPGLCSSTHVVARECRERQFSICTSN